MNEMLQQGVQLMLWGMGVVFALLALLVFVVKGMSGVAMAVDRSGPVPVRVPSPVPAEVTAGDGELVAAVTAALHRHRTRSKNQA